jgi:hypothetical protein
MTRSAGWPTIASRALLANLLFRREYQFRQRLADTVSRAGQDDAPSRRFAALAANYREQRASMNLIKYLANDIQMSSRFAPM